MTFKHWSCQIDYMFMALIRLKSDWPRVRALSILVIYQPGSRFYVSVNTTAPSVPLTHVPGLQTISSTMPSTLQFTQSRFIVHWRRVFMQHRQPSLRALFMPDLCNDLRRTVQCMHAQESCSYEELIFCFVFIVSHRSTGWLPPNYPARSVREPSAVAHLRRGRVLYCKMLTDINLEP